ncbi:carboxypeptidase-like regulatory domain-containing protein, partial [Patescibacteria group bacterium]|nr:carboxypeptidase-like regulatory domain-containing protein [Patescibacteria group bacterium]
LNPSTSGVANNNEGTLSGYAWGENTGWINFSGVTINSEGQFTGAATGDVVGTINFNCSGCEVKTDWRPVSIRGGGGLPSGAYSAPTPPFRILINNGAATTNSQIVTLKFNVGNNTARIAISNTADFKDAVQEDYHPQKPWDLCGRQEEICKNLIFPSIGLSLRVYVKFYTQYGQASEVLSSSIIFDNQPPVIEITGAKTSYNFDEDIILSGVCEPNSKIVLYWVDKYGLGYTDEQGKWWINLGKLSGGTYQLRLTPEDAMGNVGKTLTIDLIIEAVPTPPAPPITQVIDRLKTVFKPFIPKIFLPETPTPEVIVTVPEKAPSPLKGEWKILPQKQLESFVLEPLPTEIRALAKKFPQLERTFEKVGITKITDIGKLKGTKITLPGLTEVVGLPEAEVEPGRFSLPKGIPIARLTAQAKARIPTEIVFAKSGGGLIDYNITLSLTEKGQPEQIITTIAGKLLELVVKPDRPVILIKGYVVFKSKKAKPLSFNLPLESLTASLVFANPNLAFTPTPNFGVGASPQEKPIEIENKLVLMEFEYKDPDGDGIYTASIIAPVVDGEYEVITVIYYKDEAENPKAIRMITIVDPEGYIYEKDGDKETRINGAIVSLYWLNTETKQYELWSAKEYNQENPQTTDVRGVYSFLVPEGHYYLRVIAPGYLIYDGKPFQVKEGSGVHVNIELKTKYWWLKIVDWKTALLAIVILLLVFNFYRDFKTKKLTENLA